MTATILRPVDETSPHWEAQALCALSTTLTLNDWFPEGQFVKNSRAYAEHVARLRATCRACPVIEQCRERVDHFRIKHGFFAGETASERKFRWFPKCKPTVDEDEWPEEAWEEAS